MNIGQLTKQCLLSGKTAKETQDILDRVFPNNKSTLKCVYYYSSQLKKSGQFGGLKKAQEVNQDELTKVMKSLKVA